MATIDLSLLPPPSVVEKRDYETLLAERKATLISLYPEEQRAAVARTLSLESEPLVKLLQENAYREVILRQRVNDAARAVMVAYAVGSDLDQLGANNNVERLVIIPAAPTAIPPIEAVMESDSDFRVRIPQAFEGLSVAGPTGAYEYHAKSADGRVADASAISPTLRRLGQNLAGHTRSGMHQQPDHSHTEREKRRQDERQYRTRWRPVFI
ncbi:baseplate assembly protein J [Yersinia enterocolitica]|nr:baseplate assembly protein J [Yersinia enterocolitica]